MLRTPTPSLCLCVESGVPRPFCCKRNTQRIFIAVAAANSSPAPHKSEAELRYTRIGCECSFGSPLSLSHRWLGWLLFFQSSVGIRLNVYRCNRNIYAHAAWVMVIHKRIHCVALSRVEQDEYLCPPRQGTYVLVLLHSTAKLQRVRL